jgi:chromate transporter
MELRLNRNFKVLIELFWVFFKVGSFTFGGGYAMMPLIQKEVAEERRWVSETEVVDIFAIAQSVPGVIAINSSIFIGNKVAGVAGAIMAALGMILPAFVSIILILLVLTGIQGNRYVEKVFAGIRAASAALILLAAVKIGKSVLKKRRHYLIALLCLLGIVLLNINAVWAVVFGGAVGWIGYRLGKREA